jgi:hypothetical protein
MRCVIVSCPANSGWVPSRQHHARGDRVRQDLHRGAVFPRHAKEIGDHERAQRPRQILNEVEMAGVSTATQ